MSIKEITKARFDAFAAYSRHPMAAMMSEEVAWLADDAEHVLGVVLRDLTDSDFLYLVLGRDENGQFRCIYPSHSFETAERAKAKLAETLRQYEASGDTVFPQGDGRPRRQDLFAPVVPEERLNSLFRALIEQEGYSPALGIIKEMSYHFQDPDGNFVQQFQTDGFDSRIWELYLFAFLTENGFVIDRNHNAPDFTAVKFGRVVCIEAVTVNPTTGGKDTTAQVVKEPTTPDEVATLLTDYAPIKFGSPLFSKLQKRYWELDHVKDVPLVFAIQDFHLPASMLWTTSALPVYLYGVRHAWEYDEEGNLTIIPEPVEAHQLGDKEIPSGFFFQKDAEHVSAVLFSNSGTISKFNRMGYLAGFGSRRVKMFRRGTCVDLDPNAAAPKQFVSLVHEHGYTETWAEGLSMFHNPRALRPVHVELFPGIAHHFYEDGQVRSFVPDFHPYGSVTLITVERDQGG